MTASLDSSATYKTPIYHPVHPHRSLKLTPSISTRKSHFRRLYDIYNISLQRNDIPQARRAYSILVRCKEFDWAANWRSGLEMVSLPLEEDDQEDSNNAQADVTINEERLRIREKRLLALKTDYLRECHIIHSRIARKRHSLREPEAILLQIVLLLASVNKHAEALNELELYLPVSPYRDNALLHYYAGLLCIYLAQAEVLRHQTLTSSQHQQILQSSSSGSNTAPAFGGQSSQDAFLGFPSSSQGAFAGFPASSSSVPSTPGGRPRSSSTSSSNSSSSSDDEQRQGPSQNFFSSQQSSSHKVLHSSQGDHHHHHSQSQHSTKSRSFNQLSHSKIKDAIQFSFDPSLDLIKKIAQDGNGMIYIGDARKWMELAGKIAEENGGRFYQVEEWLGLLNGQSIEETRALRKLEVVKEARPTASTASNQRREDSFNPPSSSSTSTIRKPHSQHKLKSVLSKSSHASLPPSSSSAPSSTFHTEDAHMSTSSSPPAHRLTREHTSDSIFDNGRAITDDNDDDDDDDDNSDDSDDPFGRSRKERKKRKRQSKMVTFASIDQAFDLDDMSD